MEGNVMIHERRAALILGVAGLVAAASVAALFAAEDDTVVITRPGVVFHKTGSSDLHGRGIERSLSRAQATGYVPCPICFSKTASATPDRGVSSTTLLSRVTAAGVIGLPPGLGRMATPITQPEGTKGGVAAGGARGHEGIRDPFEAPRTVTNPARDQGAYGSRQ